MGRNGQKYHMDIYDKVKRGPNIKFTDDIVIIVLYLN